VPDTRINANRIRVLEVEEEEEEEEKKLLAGVPEIRLEGRSTELAGWARFEWEISITFLRNVGTHLPDYTVS
jgi:hypothetical protein